MDTKRKAKLLAAVVGGSALATMGALAMTVDEAPAATTHVAVGQLTMAATYTVSGKDDTVEATSVAVPALKGPAPLPSEERVAAS